MTQGKVTVRQLQVLRGSVGAAPRARSVRYVQVLIFGMAMTSTVTRTVFLFGLSRATVGVAEY